MRSDPQPTRAERRSSRQIREDVNEELHFHLEMRAKELEAEGMDPAAARAEALRRFGDLDAARRQCFESDRGRERSLVRKEYLDEMAQDLSHGVRQLRARPLFTLAAVLTLAIGIGATTAIFGAADHVLFHPLPYRDVERVMTLWESDRATSETKKEVSPGNYLEWQKRSTSFEAMGLAEPTGYDLTGDRMPEPVSAWRVSEGYFEALGVSPILGRTFQPDAYRPGGPQVILISHGFWQRRFASDPAVVGRTIEIDGQPATIVGVLPADLEYPQRKDLWAPKHFRPDELADRRSSYMSVVARLKPGRSMAAAQAELDRVTAQLAAEFPRTNATLGIHVVPLEEQVLGPVRPALLVLLGAVVLMLLIACANIAGLLLARGAEREREFAVRSALGANHSRLTRQLLTESVLLAGIGGAFGIALAWWGTETLVALSPPWLPRVSSVALDGRVLGFGLAVTLASSLLFGLVPALRFSRPELVGSLGSGGRSTPTLARARLRAGLVVTEIALGLVLLVGAGLLVRSFGELLANDVGFAADHRASVQLFLWDGNPAPAQRIQRVEEITARFRALPGVEEVGLTTALPFHPSQIDAQGSLVIEGRPARGDERESQVFTTVASAEYFRVMGVPLRRGRAFGPRDRGETPRVALVNEALARRCFPGEDPIGKRVTIGVMSAPESRRSSASSATCARPRWTAILAPSCTSRSCSRRPAA